MRVLLGCITFISLLSNGGVFAQEAQMPAAAPEAAAEVAPAPTPEQTPAPVASPAPSAPAAPAAPVAASSSEDSEIRGIDTVNVDEPQGNWLFKRVWWEKAEDKYERIKTLVEQILEKRMDFYERHTEIDRQVFDPFYLHVGNDLGRITEVIAINKDELERLRTKGEGLSIEERTILSTLEKEQETLDQLKKDIDIIGQYDEEINKVLTTLMDQMNLIRKFERDAWDDFKAIAKALSDKKAKELYYQMDTAWKNVNQVQDYVSGPLMQHFDQLSDRVKDYTERVKTALAALKEKGVDLKKQADALEAEREGRVTPQPAAAEDDEDEALAPERGWFDWFFDLINQFVNWVMSFFAGSSAQSGEVSEDDSDEEPASAPVEKAPVAAE